MEVIKKLGNNAAICKDNSGRELIALRLGIGFPKCPYTLDDLSKIERTFYNVDNEYLYLFENVDSNILALSADVIDLATTMLSVSLKENAIYTLADHLNFAVIRLNKGMIFNTPISNELRDLYPVEVKVAKYTLNLMKKKLNIELPEEEMYAIAMNIINSEEILSSTSDVSVKSEFILEIVHLIEAQMHISIDKNSFNYSRFASHMQYLFRRKSEYTEISSTNKKLFELLKNEYPMTYQCVLGIKELIFNKFNWNIGDEELLYLILHVNRLCSHEGVTNESA
ncbi:PRD domain-containing protein [Holdemanella biformis]|uniref:PRD domain-containing protein n=1 Tax=Holdemanella biformis TaxID=1735 RepID=UPI0022E49D75|nr:PRD domain-containing protein [Holdemanella biformis]